MALAHQFKKIKHRSGQGGGEQGSVSRSTPHNPMLMNAAQRECPEIKGTHHLFRDGEWNGGSFVAFRTEFCRVSRRQMGTSKMDRHDQELLDKQMRRLSPPRNDAANAVLLAAMFLVGMALGSVL